MTPAIWVGIIQLVQNRNNIFCTTSYFIRIKTISLDSVRLGASLLFVPVYCLLFLSKNLNWRGNMWNVTNINHVTHTKKKHQTFFSTFPHNQNDHTILTSDCCKLTLLRLFLSSLWSYLSMWGHFLIVLNLRNPYLMSAHRNLRGNAH